MVDRTRRPGSGHGSRRRGYTLIELLIVVGLLGLAGALLVPHLVGQDSMKVQAAVRQLIADLSFAQSDALANQQFRRVHFYDDGSGYCLLRADETNYNTNFDDLVAPDYVDDPLGSAGSLGQYIIDFSTDDRFEGVSISVADIDGFALGSGAVDIVYDSLGGTVTAVGGPGVGGSVTLTSGTDSYRVDVNPFTGKLTVNKL